MPVLKTGMRSFRDEHFSTRKNVNATKQRCRNSSRKMELVPGRDHSCKQSKLIKANRPDVIVIDQEPKKYLLIGAAIPAEGNSSVKVKEKLSKS